MNVHSGELQAMSRVVEEIIGDVHSESIDYEIEIETNDYGYEWAMEWSSIDSVHSGEARGTVKAVDIGEWEVEVESESQSP